jgi:hypothetical protein
MSESGERVVSESLLQVLNKETKERSAAAGFVVAH